MTKPMNAAKNEPWKNTRNGFKHELVRILTEQGFSRGEAEEVIEAIFSSIKVALFAKGQRRCRGL